MIGRFVAWLVRKRLARKYRREVIAKPPPKDPYGTSSSPTLRRPEDRLP